MPWRWIWQIRHMLPNCLVYGDNELMLIPSMSFGLQLGLSTVWIGFGSTRHPTRSSRVTGSLTHRRPNGLLKLDLLGLRLGGSKLLLLQQQHFKLWEREREREMNQTKVIPCELWKIWTHLICFQELKAIMIRGHFKRVGFEQDLTHDDECNDDCEAVPEATTVVGRTWSQQ